MLRWLPAQGEHACLRLQELLKAAGDDVSLNRALSDLLRRLGRSKEALAHFQRAVDGGFDDAPTLLKYARALKAAGRKDERLALLERTVQAHPSHSGAWRALAQFHIKEGVKASALAAARQLVKLKPNDAESHANLGIVWRSLGRHLDALASFERAIALDPSNPQIVGLAAATQKRLGYDAEAFARFDAIRPWIFADPSRCSEYLFYLLQGDADRERVYRAHLEFGDSLAGVPPITAHVRSGRPNRRLKVGYVSADFKKHVVTRFIEPVFEHHDRAAFEIYGYSNVAVPDAITQSLAAKVDHWRPIATMGDREAAQLIARDQIDILVDLSGHTKGNRLPVFAHKPAPIQVSWIGYPGTTGLPQMDYRITDSLIGGPQAQDFVRETLFRLPRVSSSYHSPPPLALGPPPCLANGHITFGSTNSMAKIGPRVIAVWTQVLNATPGARLLLKTNWRGDRQIHKIMRQRFAAAGLDSSRLDFEDHEPEDAYLRSYDRIDILLDPFPYTGGTTTRGAVWMGVPAITLEGAALHERLTAALMRGIGLDDLVATSTADYVALASKLASTPHRLADLRLVLRDRLREAFLLDSVSNTRDLEDAFRVMWRDWLAGRDLPPS